VVIQYNGDKSFSFENGMIDLRGDNEGIYYDKGFVIDGDFTLKKYLEERLLLQAHMI
jgi:hypothetical protein